MRPKEPGQALVEWAASAFVLLLFGIEGSQVQDFACSVDTAGFQPGGTITATARGHVDLSAFPIASGVLSSRVPLM
jgi:hypothetical protein